MPRRMLRMYKSVGAAEGYWVIAHSPSEAAEEVGMEPGEFAPMGMRERFCLWLEPAGSPRPEGADPEPLDLGEEMGSWWVKTRTVREWIDSEGCGPFACSEV